MNIFITMRRVRGDCVSFDRHLYKILTDKIERKVLINADDDLMTGTDRGCSSAVIRYMEKEEIDISTLAPVA